MAISLEKRIYAKNNYLDVLSKIFSKEDVYSIWGPFLKENRHYIFFYKILLLTIGSLNKGEYTAFDAHTTANCCHGMSVLARLLILANQNLNLEIFSKEIHKKLSLILKESNPSSINWLPWQLVALASLYALTYVGEIDPKKGRRTIPQKLKTVFPVGTKFSEKLVRNLQRIFSNIVANSYQIFVDESIEGLFIAGASITDWGKYIHHKSLR